MFNHHTIRRTFRVSREEIEAFCLVGFGAVVLAVLVASVIYR